MSKARTQAEAALTGYQLAGYRLLTPTQIAEVVDVLVERGQLAEVGELKALRDDRDRLRRDFAALRAEHTERCRELDVALAERDEALLTLDEARERYDEEVNR